MLHHTDADLQAMRNSFCKADAIKYFKWVQGNRTQHEFFNAIKIWQLPVAVLPEDCPHNFKLGTQAKELIAREKVFCLWFIWYLEEGPVKLLISCFSNTKVDGIKVVWDLEANWHNKALWVSFFYFG